MLLHLQYGDLHGDDKVLEGYFVRSWPKADIGLVPKQFVRFNSKWKLVRSDVPVFFPMADGEIE